MPPVEHVKEFCDGCAIVKQHRTLFPRATGFRAEKPLELVHMDLCGPITPPTAGGKKYFLLLIDDHSRYMWLELIRTKDEALRFFKKVKALAETERGSKLLAFRSDRGGSLTPQPSLISARRTASSISPLYHTHRSRTAWWNGGTKPSWRWLDACSRQWRCQGHFGGRQ
jgi:hypothetical protein